MSETDKVFTGSIAEIYDTHLVPLIFESYADDLAERTAAIGPESVLETAAGSGVVTRAVAPVLKSDTRYVVTDLNQPMLDRAASMQAERERIEWQRADALDLPFADQTFDLILCQFAAMFFPDRFKAYAEAHRVLRPDGVFIFSMWDRIEENEFAHVVAQTVAEAFPEDPPGFLGRTPYAYYDAEVLRIELEAAGFNEVIVEPLKAISLAGRPAFPAIAFCQGTPLRNEIESRRGPSLPEVTDLATNALSSRFGSGPVSGRIRAFVITARRSAT